MGSMIDALAGVAVIALFAMLLGVAARLADYIEDRENDPYTD